MKKLGFLQFLNGVEGCLVMRLRFELIFRGLNRFRLGFFCFLIGLLESPGGKI